MSLLNKLVEMDHDVGKTNSPPKMISIYNYYWWKERFIQWVKLKNLRMFMCISVGYERPMRDFNGQRHRATFTEMTEEEKAMYEAENKAHSAITMSLP